MEWGCECNHRNGNRSDNSYCTMNKSLPFALYKVNAGVLLFKGMVDLLVTGIQIK